MTVELAMIVPTRGRPGNIRKVISAWDFTNAWDVADLIIVADSDDPEIQGYRDVVAEFLDMVPDGEHAPIMLVEMAVWMPMVHKLDAVAKDIAQGWPGRTTYFALGFAGDDHLPQTINWAKTYLAKLHELETGLVHGDDGYQGANICTEWAVTSDVVRTLGRMIPAPVEHMYSDVSLHDLMTEAGALAYLPQVRIEHMHPIVKKAENDDQYKRVNSREQFARDKTTYDKWKNGRKSEQLAAVRALRPDRPVPPKPQPRPHPVQRTRGVKVARSGPTRRKADTIVNSRDFPFSREFKEVRGATPDEIGMTLADFAAQVPADQEIVELGVFQGRTALIMAWGAAQGQGAHVTGVDAWDLEGNTYGPPFTDPDSLARAHYWISQLGYTDRITLVKNFASDFAAGWTAWEGTKKIGLLFVDDDHSYEGARRAVEDWAPHLAEGAVIAIDDYGHPDWPGVEMAVTDLVAEGVLAPVTIYHERLAVTRLTTRQEWATTGHAAEPIGQVTAITSEGVSPSPGFEIAMETEGPVSPEVIELMTGYPLDSNHHIIVELPKPVDQEVSTEAPPLRVTVHEGELDGVAEGTPITELTIPQMKTLARRRNIILGVRKDKRDLIVQALADGK